MRMVSIFDFRFMVYLENLDIFYPSVSHLWFVPNPFASLFKSTPAVGHDMNGKFLSRVRVHNSSDMKRKRSWMELIHQDQQEPEAPKGPKKKKPEPAGAGEENWKGNAMPLGIVVAWMVMCEGGTRSWLRLCSAFPLNGIIYFISLCAANSLCKGFKRLLSVASGTQARSLFPVLAAVPFAIQAPM